MSNATLPPGPGGSSLKVYGTPLVREFAILTGDRWATEYTLQGPVPVSWPSLLCPSMRWPWGMPCVPPLMFPIRHINRTWSQPREV